MGYSWGVSTRRADPTVLPIPTTVPAATIVVATGASATSDDEIVPITASARTPRRCERCEHVGDDR
jgi:hypothetical protein